MTDKKLEEIITSKKLEEKEKKAVEIYKNLGYTFNSLVSEHQRILGYNEELLRRLRLIDKMGSVCFCSAMVYDQEAEGNTVPFLYCVIRDGEKDLCCPYVFPSAKEGSRHKESIEKALELHKELQSENDKR